MEWIIIFVILSLSYSYSLDKSIVKTAPYVALGTGIVYLLSNIPFQYVKTIELLMENF